MKKKLSILLVVVALAAAGYWLFGGGENQQAAQGGAQQARPLQAIRLSERSITTYEELPGRTTAYKVAEIRPQVSGIITERLFKEGGAVKEGQQLYQIDPAPYQAAYDSAKADVQKAEANVKSIKARNRRYEELVKIDAVSKQEYEDIQASLAQANADIAIAKAAVAQAKINLDYTKVYAPIAGTIGKSTVTKGALVTAGQTTALATITSLDPIYVDMTQSSDDLMRLRASARDYENIPVTLFLGESGQAYPHKGKLQFHEVTVEQTTGSVQLRALFPNPDSLLLPGMFVRARLALEQPDALLVPQHAAARQPDGNLSVWKLDETGAVQPATISTGGALDGNWIVTGGVKEGDVIITEGLIGLKPGVKVTPVFAEAKAPAPSEPDSGE
ncbi:MAG: efflux RND transporter periplasmic adaptor subunit [Alphaproteobacteria bacterium]|jgi:membrane fusion protein, multidrug efflux system|nr:efflux RND transporter periplasmic adaptor subunit [Alphaproteobacteria bacterium]